MKSGIFIKGLLFTICLHFAFSNENCCHKAKLNKNKKSKYVDSACSCETEEDLHIATLPAKDMTYPAIDEITSTTLAKTFTHVIEPVDQVNSFQKFKNESIVYYPNSKSVIYPVVYYLCIEIPTKYDANENIMVSCDCENNSNSILCCLPGVVLFLKSDNKTDMWNCSMVKYSEDQIEVIDSINHLMNGSDLFMLTYNNFTCVDCERANIPYEYQWSYVLIEGVELYDVLTFHTIPLIFKEMYRCRNSYEGGLYTNQMLKCEVSKKAKPLYFVEYYTVLNILSVFSYAVTLVVFVLLPDIRTMKSKIIICQTVSFLILNVANLRFYAAGVQLPQEECILSAYMVHFWNLVGTFWINVLCIDMAWTFSGSQFYRSDRWKFLVYSIYAWGIPIAIIVLTAAVGHFDSRQDSQWTPAISYNTCWFKHIKSMMVYHYGPVFLLTLANGPLVCYTIYKITRALCGSSILDSNGSGRHAGSKPTKSRKRFIIYTNLGLMLGTPRIISIIKLFNDDERISLVVNAISMLRSVFIFMFVCCRPNVISLLRNRLFEWRSRYVEFLTTGCWQNNDHDYQKESFSYVNKTESSTV